MERLLEETLLFDNSLEYPDICYGYPWPNIQNKMSKILYKPHSVRVNPLNTKPTAFFQLYQKSSQNKQNSKISPSNKIPSTSPSKFLPFTQIKLEKDLTLRYNQCLSTIQQQHQKTTKKSLQNISLMKKQLVLLENYDIVESHSRNLLFASIGTETMNQMSFRQQPYKNVGQKRNEQIPKKKEAMSKSKLKNSALANKDIAELISTKQMIPSNRVKQNQNFPLYINSPDVLKLNDLQTQAMTFQRNTNSQKTTKKSSFQSLDNLLNTQKNSKINTKRKSSIQHLPNAPILQKIKTISIQFKRDINDKQSPICMMGPIQQNLPIRKNTYCHDNFIQDQYYIKASTENPNTLANENCEDKNLQFKIPLQSMTPSYQHLIKQKGISTKQISDLPASLRTESQYKTEISDLKKLIKDHYEIKNQIIVQKINLIDGLHFPSIKSRTQSGKSKKCVKTPKKKISFAQSSKKSSNLKLKVKTQRKNQSQEMKQTSKLSSLHLILKNDKKKTLEASNVSEKQTKQTQKTQNYVASKQTDIKNPLKKISLSSVLNGKVKLADLSNKELNQYKQISKSCFFTNYKGIQKSSSMSREKNEQLKPIFKERHRMKSEMIESSKENLPTNLFNEKNEMKYSQITSRCQIRDKNKFQGCLETNKIDLQKVSVQQISENKCEENSKERMSRQKRKGQFLIKRNLDAEKNISLLKLSQNLKKKKLVIIRK